MMMKLRSELACHKPTQPPGTVHVLLSWQYDHEGPRNVYPAGHVYVQFDPKLLPLEHDMTRLVPLNFTMGGAAEHVVAENANSASKWTKL